MKYLELKREEARKVVGGDVSGIVFPANCLLENIFLDGSTTGGEVGILVRLEELGFVMEPCDNIEL